MFLDIIFIVVFCWSLWTGLGWADRATGWGQFGRALLVIWGIFAIGMAINWARVLLW